MLPPPPSSTLFPYTTLFRSLPLGPGAAQRRNGEDFNIMAKLKHGVTAAEAQADMDALTARLRREDRKSTRLNSSHLVISYAVFCLKKKSHKSLVCHHIEHDE